MKKKIALNLLGYGLCKPESGVEVFIKNVVKYMVEEDLYQYFLIVSNYKCLEDIRVKNKHKVIILGRIFNNRLLKIAGEQILLPIIIKLKRINVIISNYTIPIITKSKSIVIIHDLQFRVMPHLIEKLKLSYWNFIIPYAIKKSNKVGTISEFSKKEISAYYPEITDKVFVVTEGVKFEKNRNSSLIDNKKKGNYLLTVTSFGKHKNDVVLIKAFKLLLEKYPKLKLKIIGTPKTPDAKRMFLKLKIMVNEYNLNNSVEFLGYVTDKKLCELYSKCKAYIFPSLYEGFGLPLIEAQSCGAPVISSNAGALPEIGGDSCIYFNPTNENELAKKVINLFTDEKKQKELIEKGYVNSAKYTWEKGASQLINAIKTVI